MSVLFYLEDVAILLSKSSASHERGQAKIEQLGETSRLVRPVVSGTGAVKRSNDSRELCQQD